MSRSGAFIAVDWGTTNRRAWRIGADGAVEDALADARGIIAARETGFAAEAADLRARLGDLPMLLGGMIGSDRGWRAVPYVPAPADVHALAAGIAWIDERTGIVPGVCQRPPLAPPLTPEVMRGEEVQIIGGLASGALADDALVCCPGTHAKWARIERKQIARFATWMTGEVFALMSRHSLLAPQLEGQAAADESFAAGVAATADGDALGHLFALRAGAMLGAPLPNGTSYVSGLLIGGEVRAALARFPGVAPVLIGRPDLCALYSAAIAQICVNAEHCAAPTSIIDGEAAFRDGIRAIIAELT